MSIAEVIVYLADLFTTMAISNIDGRAAQYHFPENASIRRDHDQILRASKVGHLRGIVEGHASPNEILF